MKRTTIILSILLVGVTVWFVIDHIILSKKLTAETSVFTAMQTQNASQAIGIIKLQTCASTAEEIYNSTGKYFSVIDCVNSESNQ
jgi:hypothetical protein